MHSRGLRPSSFGNRRSNRLNLNSLNLAVANQVHIIEPQWNPSVEEQAVARAVRMGQKREVTIYRYVLQNTVEQVSYLTSKLNSQASAEYHTEHRQTPREEETLGQVHTGLQVRSKYLRCSAGKTCVINMVGFWV